MLTAKWRHSLTAKIFLAIFLLLVAACALTYGFISWVMPLTYTADWEQNMALQSELLAGELEQTTLEDCGALLSAFSAQNDARVWILDRRGEPVKGDALSVPEELGEWASLGVCGEEAAFSFSGLEGAGVVQTIDRGFSFSDSAEEYQLLVLGSTGAVNQAAEALARVWPCLAAAVLAASALSALLCARLITRPIVEISAISQRLSALDLTWRCREDRTDEIVTLARNLNQLTGRLSAAMEQLRSANAALQADIDRERELEQTRLDFFAAASHELKTPLTILKGQLGGMLDGVGRYADRERWLARSLAVVGRMESLVRELLTVSRMEKEGPMKVQSVDLSDLTRRCAREYDGLFEQKSQGLELELPAPVRLAGDPALLKKAVCNLLSNAGLYSPEGAAVRAAVREEGGMAVLTVENQGASLAPEAIPHLFEAFYRVEGSRNRQTGGSGLGLYLVRTIAERHGGACAIRNTPRGVEARLVLPISTENTQVP